MRNVDDGEEKKKERKEKIMMFLVATTSLPAVYRPNDDAQTTTAGTPHARANIDNALNFPRIIAIIILVAPAFFCHC